jgi:hypothetical protein
MGYWIASSAEVPSVEGNSSSTTFFGGLGTAPNKLSCSGIIPAISEGKEQRTNPAIHKNGNSLEEARSVAGFDAARLWQAQDWLRQSFEGGASTKPLPCLKAWRLFHVSSLASTGLAAPIL